MFRLLREQPCACELQRLKDRLVLMRSFIFRAKEEGKIAPESIFAEAKRLDCVDEAVLPLIDLLIDDNPIAQLAQYEEV